MLTKQHILTEKERDIIISALFHIQSNLVIAASASVKFFSNLICTLNEMCFHKTVDIFIRILGFAGATLNSMDSVSDRDYLIELLSAMSTIMMHLRFQNKLPSDVLM